MPKRKRKETEKSTKKIKETACSVGFCGDEEKIKVCQFKRAPGVTVEKEIFGARKDDKNTFYYDSLFKNYWIFRFFQKDTKPFNNIELHDIAIHLQITTYHTTSRANLLNIPTIGGKNTTITKLLSPMTINYYIVEFCDLDLAKKKDNNTTLDDILVDKDLKNIQFKSSVKIRLKDKLIIECSDCEFTEDEIIMCFNLKQLRVCTKFDEETESKVFNQGNYAFIILIDYMDWQYQFRRAEKNDNPNEIIQFGNGFDPKTGTSGIPGYFSNGYIEYTWRADVKHAPTMNRLMQTFTQCCDKKEEDTMIP
jgi:hypothetical protein